MGRMTNRARIFRAMRPCLYVWPICLGRRPTGPDGDHRTEAPPSDRRLCACRIDRGLDGVLLSVIVVLHRVPYKQRKANPGRDRGVPCSFFSLVV